MATIFPHTGETLALRVADGSELVVRVRSADRPRIALTPAIPAATGEGIEAAFVAADGTGYRVRGRVVHREMHETSIEVEGVTPLCGRFLRRFAPDRPLIADLAICDERAPSTARCRAASATWRWPGPASRSRGSARRPGAA